MDNRSPNWKETKFPSESKMKKILCYIHILESVHHWKFFISENLKDMYHLFPLSALAPIQLPTIMSLPIIDYVPKTFYSMLPCARPELFVMEWHQLHNNLESLTSTIHILSQQSSYFESISDLNHSSGQVRTLMS